MILTDFRPGCTFMLPRMLPGANFNPNAVYLQYQLRDKREIIPRVSSSANCGTKGGWYYDDPLQPTRIELCPTTCEAIGLAVSASVDVIFGCQTVEG